MRAQPCAGCDYCASDQIAAEQIAAGNVHHFTDAEQALAWLNDQGQP